MDIPIIPPENVQKEEIKKKKIDVPIQQPKVDIPIQQPKVKKEKIPIINLEEIEELMEEELKEDLGEGQEETQIEGREDEILEELLRDVEEEEKKRHIVREKVRKEKENIIYIGPTVPRLSIREKGHMFEVPIVPSQEENNCCNKLCKDLNDEIFSREESLGAVRTSQLPRVGMIRKSYGSLPNSVEALKDYRSALKDNNVCTCYKQASIKDIQFELPVLKEDILVSAKTGKPITLSPRIPRFEPPLMGMRIVHRKDKPIVPTHDGCCENSCKILTKEIDRINNNLDQMEMAGAEFRKRARLLPRYQALTYRVFSLEEYRTKLAKNKICECFKR